MALIHKPFTRRRLLAHSSLTLLGAGVFASVLEACSSAPRADPAAPPTAAPRSAPADSAWQAIVDAARKEGAVTMYGTLLGSEDVSKVALAFKQSTGITFDFIGLQGGPATTRIREEVKVNKGPDIFEASGGWVGQFAPEGVFTPLKDKPLPVWGEPDSVWYAHPAYKKPDDYQYVLSRLRPRHGHISVNTKGLAESDYPRTWHDLATNPKYKGNIVYLDPTATTGASVIFVMNGYVAKSMTAADFWGLFAGQDPLLMGQTRQEYTAVAQGQRAICLNATDETVLNLLQAGAPVKNLYFADLPYPAQTAEMGVLKTAQHPNAGLVFINWYLSKDGQDAVSQIQYQNPIRRDVKSYVPDFLVGDVIGGGARGKVMIERPLQTQLGSEVQNSGLFRTVVDRQPQEVFVSGWESFIKDWETKHGGPQDQPNFLENGAA